jgi:hypothetical protein
VHGKQHILYKVLDVFGSKKLPTPPHKASQPRRDFLQQPNVGVRIALLRRLHHHGESSILWSHLPHLDTEPELPLEHTCNLSCNLRYSICRYKKHRSVSKFPGAIVAAAPLFYSTRARSQSESQDRLASTWDMLKNGALLAEADRVGFSVLITSDKGIGISNQ